MNPRFVLALSVSAGMALLVTAIFYQVAMRGREPAKEPIATAEVVVAASDLEIGSRIEVTDLKLEPWPKDKIPADTFSDLGDVVERVPITRILANEPVSGRRLSPPGSGLGLAPKVPPGMRAISVRVNDVIGVSGFVLPEARVDVLVTGTPRTGGDSSRMTRTILSNVRVISAGENLEPDASGKPQRVPVVTLLVTPDQAELLTLASTQGRLQLVLRNSRDDKQIESDGIREPEVFLAELPKPKPPPRRPAPPPPPVQPEPPPPRPRLKSRSSVAIAARSKVSALRWVNPSGADAPNLGLETATAADGRPRPWSRPGQL